MARTKGKGSKISFDGLGLTIVEDKALMKLLIDKDISMAKIKRLLIRAWIKNPVVKDEITIG